MSVWLRYYWVNIMCNNSIVQYMSWIVHLHLYVYVDKWIVKSTTKMYRAVTWPIKICFFITRMKVSKVLVLLHGSLYFSLQLVVFKLWQVIWLVNVSLLLFEQECSRFIKNDHLPCSWGSRFLAFHLPFHFDMYCNAHHCHGKYIVYCI